MEVKIRRRVDGSFYFILQEEITVQMKLMMCDEPEMINTQRRSCFSSSLFLIFFSSSSSSVYVPPLTSLFLPSSLFFSSFSFPQYHLHSLHILFLKCFILLFFLCIYLPLFPLRNPSSLPSPLPPSLPPPFPPSLPPPIPPPVRGVIQVCMLNAQWIRSKVSDPEALAALEDLKKSRAGAGVLLYVKASLHRTCIENKKVRLSVHEK